MACEFNMATFASAIGSGDVYYGDSTPEAVAGLNEKFGLGLTAEELKSIPNKAHCHQLEKIRGHVAQIRQSPDC